ncbi:MAG: isochorismatase family protein [Desulfurivibrionaceae bacterium]
MQKPQFLSAGQCSFYVIDPQERLMAKIHEADRVVGNISLMINLARILDIPVITSTQYKKGVGPIVPEIAEQLGEVDCPDKVEFNGLDNPGVKELFDGLSPSVDTLLLCGVETHICVYQSAIGALREGYKVRVVADAVSSRDPENDSLGRERLRELGAVLAPAEMVIYELLRKAGTPEFKAMLPWLK